MHAAYEHLIFIGRFQPPHNGHLQVILHALTLAQSVVVVVGSGLLLAWAEPVRLWGSPSFWVKMTLLALVGVHALLFRDVYGHPEKQDTAISSQAKLAGMLSLILWAGLVVSGRLIAFDESFEPRPIGESPITGHAVGNR